MTANQTHALIPLAKLAPSRSNPRKHFDAAALAELTESVKKHGVLQPILVRPFIVGGSLNRVSSDPEFIVVAGERRFRAAKAAGLTEIPAMVRNLTETEVLEIQVIENLQREDLHPLEEAEGYEALLKCEHADGKRYTVDEIAAKVGKSRSYVFARLKLTALCKEARQAFYDGKLTPSTALLVARIPGEGLQKKAVKEIASEENWRGPLSYRAAAEHVQRNYMLQLANAPFPTGDADLLPKAGACRTCPKRTGNQPELFGDVKSADVCTDPDCFARKREANVARLTAAAKAKGQEVIIAKDAKKLMPYDGADPKGFVRLDGEKWVGNKFKKVRELLGKDLPPVTLIEDPRSGNLIEVVREKDAAPLLKAKVPSRRGRDGEKTPQQKAREKAQRDRERLDAEIRREIYFQARERAAKELGTEDLRVSVAAYWARHWHDWKKLIAPWWVPDAPKDVKKKPGQRAGVHDRIEKVTKMIATMGRHDLTKLLLDCALVSAVSGTGYFGKTGMKDIEAFAKRHGIEAVAIRNRLAKDAKAPKVKKAASKRKP